MISSYREQMFEKMKFFLWKLHFFESKSTGPFYCIKNVIACKVGKKGGLEKCGQDMKSLCARSKPCFLFANIFKLDFAL